MPVRALCFCVFLCVLCAPFCRVVGTSESLHLGRNPKWVVEGWGGVKAASCVSRQKRGGRSGREGSWSLKKMTDLSGAVPGRNHGGVSHSAFIVPCLFLCNPTQIFVPIAGRYPFFFTSCRFFALSPFFLSLFFSLSLHISLPLSILPPIPSRFAPCFHLRVHFTERSPFFFSYPSPSFKVAARNQQFFIHKACTCAVTLAYTESYLTCPPT